MNSAIPAQPARAPATRADWLAHLKLQADLLDGIDVAMCAFDLQDRAEVWNRAFLRMFPEHDGHITQGEHYSSNLRRFYEGRLDAAELASIESYIEAGIVRHQQQGRPFEFEHRGRRLQVSSLPVPGLGRVRVWRSLAPLPSAAAVAESFAPELGTELLERVPEALVVCGQDGSIAWANASFCALFGVEQRAHCLGTSIEALYESAWDRAGAATHPGRELGMATLRDHLRFAGAPFELPLPRDRHCRVVARPARDGAIFYALIDITALKLYEAALQLTLDNAGRGIIRYDAQGRILLFNRQALELLELPEQLIASPARITDVIAFQRDRGDFTPDDEDRLQPVPGTQSPGPGGIHDVYGTHHYLRRTRTGRTLEISTRALPDGGAVRTYSDVTEYAEAQRALSEKTQALQITLDSMSQGISAIDSGGRLALWNRRYQELLDLPEALLAGRPTMDQVVRFQIERGDFGPNFEYVDAATRGFVAVGDKLAPLRGPETYVRKARDGRTFDVNTRPLPDGGVVRTFTDITAYVQSQEALAFKQLQLASLVRNLPDRVWLKDERGVFLLTNPAYQRQHGYTEEQILGRTASEMFGVERARRQAESDRKAMESQVPISYEEYGFSSDGSLRCSEIVKVAMRDDQGRSIGLLGIARDITKRKEEEAALIQAKEEAQLASGAKSRFLSSMSHEIRTPMNAVLGMLTLLRGSELSQRQDDYAAKAEGAARALLSLLNDILDFSKIEAGKMRLDCRPFSLEGMLSDLSVILSSNVGEREIEVLYDLDPRVPDGLVGDDMRLRQILINLGGNAVKFTQRGEVVVRTRLVGQDAGSASIEFTVQDSGIGITPEQQQRLFTDYVQATDGTARQFGGTGLGLGICRRLTELMDSHLQLASTPGVGSRFWFTVKLPLSGVEAADEPAAPAREGQPRVLIVDDNPLARDTLAALARSSGWHADTAQDGGQALARIEAAAALGLAYDAVFIDWVMAGMDGWQTCNRIRALPLPERTPLVIMVTAHGREMLDRRPAQEQALLDGFLVKPVTAGMLRGAMRRARPMSDDPKVPGTAAPSHPLAGLRLLLAEDNLVNQQIATELLARQGAVVDVAENGKLAVERLPAGHPYDAVLMDIQMPVMDGLEATRAIRKLHAQDALPVIAMTANAMESDREASLAAGMNDHVAKPFVLDEVIRTILKHVAARGGLAPAEPADAHPPAGQLAVFDRADALQRLGGDEELLRTVLPVFRANLASSARELAAAHAATPEDLCRTLHTIKGMAANLGAKALAHAAAQAEAQAQAGPQAELAVLAQAVAQAVTDVLEALGPAA